MKIRNSQPIVTLTACACTLLIYACTSRQEQGNVSPASPAAGPESRADKDDSAPRDVRKKLADSPLREEEQSARIAGKPARRLPGTLSLVRESNQQPQPPSNIFFPLEQTII